MGVEKIKIGNIVNDGLGDDLRTAFIKVNNNFGFVRDELEDLDLEVETTGSGESIFKEKEDSVLYFKSISAGQYVEVIDEGDTLRISSSAPTSFTSITTEDGTISAEAYPSVTFQGGIDTRVTALGSVVTIDNTGLDGVPISQVLQTVDFGELDPIAVGTTQLAMAVANVDFGLVFLPGSTELDLGTI